MKDFLYYLHTELSRLLALHKSEEKLSKEDEELLASIRQTVYLIESYAGKQSDGRLIQIADDLIYTIGHMQVWFKAEEALKDAEKNIGDYS